MIVKSKATFDKSKTTIDKSKAMMDLNTVEVAKTGGKHTHCAWLITAPISLKESCSSLKEFGERLNLSYLCYVKDYE